MNLAKIILTFFVLFFSGCSVSQKKMVLDYEKSNPVRIEKSAMEIEVSDILPSSKELDGTLAVRSIEDNIDSHIDFSVRYLIEDNLISNLLNNGYRVVERDPDILENLYREDKNNYLRPKTNGDKLPLIETLDLDALNSDSYFISNDLKDNPNTNCCDASESILDYLIEEHQSLVSDSNKLVSTGLNSADYVLSYRVLECGVSYREVEKDLGSGFQVNESLINGKYKRTARTRLHVRLTDTETSEIVTAGLLEGIVEDEISKEHASALRQIEHNYYFHTLPLMNTKEYTESDGYAKSNESQAVEVSNNNSFMWPWYIFGAFVTSLVFSD